MSSGLVLGKGVKEPSRSLQAAAEEAKARSKRFRATVGRMKVLTDSTGTDRRDGETSRSGSRTQIVGDGTRFSLEITRNDENHGTTISFLFK